jgi:threonine synthase
MADGIAGLRVSEPETRAAICDVYRRFGIVLDPHTAVAYSAALRYRQSAGTRTPVVVLATAHPAKFADVIREELGVGPELPEAERDWRSRPLLAVDLPDANPAAFKALLTSLGPVPC